MCFLWCAQVYTQMRVTVKVMVGLGQVRNWEDSIYYHSTLVIGKWLANRMGAVSQWWWIVLCKVVFCLANRRVWMQRTRGLLILAFKNNLKCSLAVSPLAQWHHSGTSKTEPSKNQGGDKKNVLLQKHSESTVYRELSALGLFQGVVFWFWTVQIGSLWESTFIWRFFFFFRFQNQKRTIVSEQVGT